ncbi:GntR family transcriptional regulator [Oscillospiraceae bacterium HV4-5-C5C]|nr:GntR family transcriptional regulator [Oscillospiraceae bacterium HV4-5-C5C]
MNHQIVIMPAREQVAAVLRRAILSGEYRPNELLTLDSVAEICGVSRTPVREAFQILAMEGLLELRPNRGAMVKDVSEDFINDHYDVRILMEGEACVKAIRHPEQWDTIKQAIASGQQACERQDVEAFNKANNDFHMAIWQASGSEKLKSFLGQLWNGLSLDSYISENEYISVVQKEHEAISQAIFAVDAEAARLAMQHHLEHSQENLLRQLALHKRQQKPAES